MGLFSHNPFKKIAKSFKRVAKVFNPIGILDTVLGGGSLENKYKEPETPKPVEETPIHAPSQTIIGTPAGKGSDVGLGDVTSIFYDDDDDPFKKLFM